MYGLINDKANIGFLNMNINYRRQQLVSRYFRSIILKKLERSYPPPVARQFLEEIWLNYLSYCLFREGDQSLNLDAALDIIDELIWSLSDEALVSSANYHTRIAMLEDMLQQGMTRLRINTVAQQRIVAHFRAARSKLSERNRLASDGLSVSTDKVVNGLAIPVTDESIPEDAPTAVEDSSYEVVSGESGNSNTTFLHRKTAIERQLNTKE